MLDLIFSENSDWMQHKNYATSTYNSDLGLFLRKPFTEIFCHFGSVLSNFFSHFLCWLTVVPVKKMHNFLHASSQKILHFYFKKDFLISFSLALFQKTTCKPFISNSEWVCRFKVERFVRRDGNQQREVKLKNYLEGV